MSKSVVIAEGGNAVTCEYVRKIAVQEKDTGNLIEFIPEDEANDYADTGELHATANGSYYASMEDLAGYNTVIVDVPLGTKTIDNVGVYNASDDGYAGYSSVEVTSAGTAVIDHSPTSSDVSGSGGVLVQYTPSQDPYLITEDGMLYQYTSVFVEVPTSDDVNITPKNQSLDKGDDLQFTANTSVVWSVYGNNDNNTQISGSGLLHIGSAETASIVYVMAVSTEYAEKFAVTTVTVTGV